MLSGSGGLLWSGPVIHDAICIGSSDAVRYLLDRQADPRSGSSFGDAEGATALWQASFNGFHAIVSLLLDRSAAYDLERASPWQDRPEHLLTPLHVAARMGHAQVVEVLIDTGAHYDTRQLLQGGSSPLRDAIQRCHVDVVKLLVRKDATVPRKALFELNNEVTIAAVAEGLTQASSQAVKGCLLPVEWLGMFLRTPGHAPAHILNAIFQSHSLKYFDFEKQRQDANMAHFDDTSSLNVKEGIPYEDFNGYFVKRQQLGKDGLQLLRGLGVEVSRKNWADPSQDEVEHYHDKNAGAQMVMKQFEKQLETNQRSSYRLRTQNTELVAPKKRRCCHRADAVLQFDSLTNNRTFMAPARVLQCILPDVLNNEYVLYAIAHSSNEDIFEFDGCQAIITLGWSQAWFGATVDSCCSMLLAILFAIITVYLDGSESVGTFGFFLVVVAVMLVTLNLVKELSLMQGMFLLGKLRHYWFTVGNYLDWCRLGLSYAVLSQLLLDPLQWHQPSTNLSVLLAITVLFRWGDVLTCFRGYQWVGEKVLPIERALLSSRAFAGIVWLACCAFTNSYVALGLASDGIFQSFFVIYRLGFLSDLEHRVWNEDNSKELVAVLGMITALCMTVVMMNIFIGVLSESYSQAYRKRHLSFQRERARIALAHNVRKRAYDAWRLTCCCRNKPSASHSKYLWYSVKQTGTGTASPRNVPKQRALSGGRRMSSILRGLLRREEPSPTSMESSPGKVRQSPRMPSSHAPPEMGSFQAVVPQRQDVVASVPGMIETPPGQTPRKGVWSEQPWERILSSGVEDA